MVAVMRYRNYEDWEQPYSESRYHTYMDIAVLMNMSVAWARNDDTVFDALDTGFVSKYQHARSAMLSGRLTELDDDAILMAVGECVRCRPWRT